ncbi:MAG: ArnT family glycosyltransferase [Janthinobacterium lividum]
MLVLILALAVHFSGINIPFFTDDPGLYGSLAKNMVQQGNYWELFSYGKDWLDKPHFPFWMAALSFKLFGVSTWSYKLPALLFFLLSGLYTYLFTKKNYDQKTALMAVLILLSAQHIFMSNTDVRAEPYLIGLIIGSVYHFYLLEKRFSWTDLILGALFAACAVMTKGVFALIPIGASVIGELIFKKRYAEMLRLKWLLAVLLTAIFILPEIYSLYVQFDSQPQKITLQNAHQSGIMWFLWDSQFGRFINSGPITRKSGSLFFYIHTLIWAFAPWFFMLIYAVFINLKKIVQKQQLNEYFSLCAALSMWLIFSLSRFQLSFYTNIIFPFFAIIIASVLRNVLSKAVFTYFKIAQLVQAGLLFLAILAFNYFLHPANQILFWGEVTGFVILVLYLSKKTSGFAFLFLLSCTVTIFVNFYLNSIFYPLLATYKADAQAPHYINQHFPGKPVYVVDSLSNPFQFYCKVPVQLLSKVDLNDTESAKKIIYTNEARLKELQQNHPVKILKAITNYPQERILKDFIWYKTREKILNKYYLISY